MNLRSLSSPAEIRTLRRDPELLQWVPENPFDDRPDRHLVWLENGERVAACCSLWWRETPELDGVRTGTIGHFYAVDETAAEKLLEAAATELKRAGAGIAIGPMDGSTWRKYRLVTNRGKDPQFFLEPDNPAAWPDWFAAAGFQPLARYTSNVMEGPPAPDARLTSARERMETRGIRIRNLDPANFENELRGIYAVSEISFRDNFLYTPLPLEIFLAQYRKIEPLVRPDLVLIAEENGRPVGFAFAILDFLEKRTGRRERTAILKTLAVLPGRRYAGLGTLLAGMIRERAAELGFPRLIHALMHESNNSRNLAKDGARTFREYTLFSKTL